MTNKIFTYLKKIGATDVQQVNDIIVSFYRAGKLHLEDVIHAFEFVISPADRVVNGSVYTPQSIRRCIVSQCLDNIPVERLNTLRIADIACGCGGFLMDVAEYIHLKTSKTFRNIYRDNIFGIDIQDYSIERTKILLKLLAQTHGEDAEFNFNLIQADTLDFHSDTWNRRYSNFDVIIGNPPYVCSRNVSDSTREKMFQYEVAQSGNPDLYIPFFQIADEMLNDGGHLGYITMNSFIHSVNGRRLRMYFSSQKKDISIVDFRGYQIFKKKSTYTCLFFLTKGYIADDVHYISNEDGNLSQPFLYSNIPYFSLDDFKGWILNDYSFIAKLESVGIPISRFCPSRHGIATLSNKTYVFKPVSTNRKYYYLKAGKETYAIEKGICQDIVNSNKLNSDVEFETIIEKVIYPYIKNENGQAIVMKEEYLKKHYPMAYQYLLAQKGILMTRDKGGACSYPIWYAYGRTQSLLMPRYKLFFPKFANKSIRCVLKDDSDLLLYNGMAFVSESKKKLLVLQKIIESRFFWEYLVKNAKPYSSKYFSLSANDIKNFGIPQFSDEETAYLLSLKSKEDVNIWLDKFYS